MNTYDFVHLTLAAMGGEIRGRTKLQKTVYFLGVITNSLDELGYRAHFYGPYSAEVGDAIDQLKSLGFVDQNVASAGSVDSAGFEVARYDYKLSEQGRTVVEQKKQAFPAEWRKIDKAAAILKRAKNEDYVKLSIAAKTYFMLGEKKGTATKAELAELASKFGWSVTKEQVEEAASYLKSLGLVNLAPKG
jgi:uncharacterized protein YwgA